MLLFDSLLILPALVLPQRYAVLNELPKSTEEIKNVASMIYHRMTKREDEGIQKLRQVIAFATGEDCRLSSQVHHYTNANPLCL